MPYDALRSTEASYLYFSTSGNLDNTRVFFSMLQRMNVYMRINIGHECMSNIYVVDAYQDRLGRIDRELSPAEAISLQRRLQFGSFKHPKIDLSRASHFYHLK